MGKHKLREYVINKGKNWYDSLDSKQKETVDEIMKPVKATNIWIDEQQIYTIKQLTDEIRWLIVQNIIPNTTMAELPTINKIADLLNKIDGA
jgi:hypothetical protein